MAPEDQKGWNEQYILCLNFWETKNTWFMPVIGPNFVFPVNGCYAGLVNHVEFFPNTKTAVFCWIKGLTPINNLPFHNIGAPGLYILNVGASVSFISIFLNIYI